MVEDAEGEGELGQFAVRHHHVGLVAALARTHTREVDGVAGAPVLLLEIAQVAGEHRQVGAPVFQTDEHAQANLVHTCLTHAVEAV